ncbi:hypothetical protein ACYA6G_005114 [Escherichia coli]|nr:hypothetical protein [Escherichia coli]
MAPSSSSKLIGVAVQ